MTDFVPPGCVSFHEALNEIYSEDLGREVKFTKQQWGLAPEKAATFRRFVRLSGPNQERMQTSIRTLQSQLCNAERIACFVGAQDLENIKPVEFMRDNAERVIARGEMVIYKSSEPVGAIFLRIPAQSDEHSLQKKRPGAPNKVNMAVRVYHECFPDGHKASGLYWSQALDQVNGVLLGRGEQKVALTTLQVALKKTQTLD